MKSLTTAVVVVVATIITCCWYFFDQQGRLVHSHGQYGFCLLKGGYRAWKFEFYDAEAWNGTNWYPVQIDVRGTNVVVREGYRFIPKYTHSDIRNLNLP